MRGRQSTRLRTHDYAGRATYFVTICTQQKLCVFGAVVDGDMVLNDLGRLVQREWLASAELRPEIGLDAFVLMPNHLHAVVRLPPAGAEHRIGGGDIRRPHSLGSLIAGFKASTSARARALFNLAPGTLWQRNYHDRVIRDGDELTRIRRYILANPKNWPEDVENPVNQPQLSRLSQQDCTS